MKTNAIHVTMLETEGLRFESNIALPIIPFVGLELIGIHEDDQKLRVTKVSCLMHNFAEPNDHLKRDHFGNCISIEVESC